MSDQGNIEKVGARPRHLAPPTPNPDGGIVGEQIPLGDVQINTPQDMDLGEPVLAHRLIQRLDPFAKAELLEQPNLGLRLRPFKWRPTEDEPFFRSDDLLPAGVLVPQAQGPYGEIFHNLPAKVAQLLIANRFGKFGRKRELGFEQYAFGDLALLPGEAVMAMKRKKQFAREAAGGPVEQPYNPNRFHNPFSFGADHMLVEQNMEDSTYTEADIFGADDPANEVPIIAHSGPGGHEIIYGYPPELIDIIRAEWHEHGKPTPLELLDALERKYQIMIAATEGSTNGTVVMDYETRRMHMDGKEFVPGEVEDGEEPDDFTIVDDDEDISVSPFRLSSAHFNTIIPDEDTVLYKLPESYDFPDSLLWRQYLLKREQWQGLYGSASPSERRAIENEISEAFLISMTKYQLMDDQIDWGRKLATRSYQMLLCVGSLDTMNDKQWGRRQQAAELQYAETVDEGTFRNLRMNQLRFLLHGSIYIEEPKRRAPPRNASGQLQPTEQPNIEVRSFALDSSFHSDPDSTFNQGKGYLPLSKLPPLPQTIRVNQAAFRSVKALKRELNFGVKGKNPLTSGLALEINISRASGETHQLIVISGAQSNAAVAKHIDNRVNGIDNSMTMAEWVLGPQEYRARTDRVVRHAAQLATRPSLEGIILRELSPRIPPAIGVYKLQLGSEYGMQPVEALLPGEAMAFKQEIHVEETDDEVKQYITVEENLGTLYASRPQQPALKPAPSQDRTAITGAEIRPYTPRRPLINPFFPGLVEQVGGPETTNSDDLLDLGDNVVAMASVEKNGTLVIKGTPQRGVLWVVSNMVGRAPHRRRRAS